MSAVMAIRSSRRFYLHCQFHHSVPQALARLQWCADVDGTIRCASADAALALRNWLRDGSVKAIRFKAVEMIAQLAGSQLLERQDRACAMWGDQLKDGT
jgi:hypothetical protein